MVAKPRVKLSEDLLLVGNDIKWADIPKMTCKSAFEQNVVCNYDVQENILDYIFCHLGITSSKVDHPILMTEAVCNPNYCRKSIKLF